MTELARLSPDDVVGPNRAEIEALSRRVFPDTDPERLEETLPRHAGRAGFCFFAALTDAGVLVGFAYGYRGGPGQWWHDLVAGAMTPRQRDEWLPPGHFELVQLGVAPEHEGQGIGGRLHDALLAEARGPTAVLSTSVGNERARGFYARRGWELLVEEIDFGGDYPPFVVLGRKLSTAAVD